MESKNHTGCSEEPTIAVSLQEIEHHMQIFVKNPHISIHEFLMLPQLLLKLTGKICKLFDLGLSGITVNRHQHQVRPHHQKRQLPGSQDAINQRGDRCRNQIKHTPAEWGEHGQTQHQVE